MTYNAASAYKNNSILTASPAELTLALYEGAIKFCNIALSELETYLYASADILRNHVEGSEYKSYVFPLLFFKRICDVYDVETQGAI